MTKTKKPSIKMVRLTHPHANLIELADGCKVCPGCGAVLAK